MTLSENPPLHGQNISQFSNFIVALDFFHANSAESGHDWEEPSIPATRETLGQLGENKTERMSPYLKRNRNSVIGIHFDLKHR